MQSPILKIVLLGTLFAMPLQASAYKALLICGSHDPAGNTELDNVTVYRGGHYENQLVIRNKNILSDFTAKGAIRTDEINQFGEFVVAGLSSTGNRAMQSTKPDGRSFSFSPTENGQLLVVHRVAPDGFSYAGVIAHFYFGSDCQSLN